MHFGAFCPIRQAAAGSAPGGGLSVAHSMSGKASHSPFTLTLYDPKNPEHKPHFEHVIATQIKEGWEIKKSYLKLVDSGCVDFYFIFTDDETPAGCISLFKDPDHHFMSIGSFIIDPSQRGKGLGRGVLAKVLDDHDGTAVLMSTPKAEALYKCLGFETQDRFFVLSLEVTPPAYSLKDFELRNPNSFEIQQLLRYDRRITGLSRERFVLTMLANATVAYVHLEDNKPVGYGMASPFYEPHAGEMHRGFRITSFADDAAVFQTVLGKMLNHLVSKLGRAVQIHLDTPTGHAGALTGGGLHYTGHSYPFLSTATEGTPSLAKVYAATEEHGP